MKTRDEHRLNDHDGYPALRSAREIIRRLRDKDNKKVKSMMIKNRSKQKRGFTLAEVLVVIAIVAVVLALVMPGIQRMREMSRRSMCQQNLVELSIALSTYHNAHQHYPAGTLNPRGPIQSSEDGYHHNWISALLPNLNANEIAETIDPKVGVYHPHNATARAASFQFLLCPSASEVIHNTTCYAGIHHSVESPIDESNNGVFVLNIATRDRDITDGLGYTLFLGEKVSDPEFDLGWISGTRSSLRNTGHEIGVESGRRPLKSPPKSEPPNDAGLFVGGLQSDHPAGAHTLTGSGEVTFRATSMDRRLLQQLGNKSDLEAPLDDANAMKLPAAESPARP